MSMIISPTAAADYVPFSQASAALITDGFKGGPPAGIREASIQIDREVCEEATCEMCGRHALTYQPYHHPRTRSYVCLAVCPACLHTEEF